MNTLSYGLIVSLAGVLGSGCFLSWDDPEKTKPDTRASSDADAGALDAGSGDAGHEGDAMPDERCVLGQGELPCKLGK